MWRFLGALAAFAVIMAALQAVLIALVVAGLIFRTKETIGLLLFFGFINLLTTYPLIGFGLLAVAGILAIVKKERSRRAAKPPMLGVSGQIEAGHLLLPDDAPWLADLKAELLGFPNTRYDDQCDALSQLMSWVQRTEAWVTPSLAGPMLVTELENGVIETTGDPFEDSYSDVAAAFALDDDPWL